MTDFVQYLIDIALFVYHTLSIDALGSDNTSLIICLVFVFLAILIAFCFMFALIPQLFKWIYTMFGRFKR